MARSPVATGRVTKRVSTASSSSSRTTGGPSRMSARQKSKLAEEVSGGGGGQGLQGMATEAPAYGYREDMDGVEGDHGQLEGDQDERPFDLMKLPAEIRNEIYRACLTRPFNILLSKHESPPVPLEPEVEDGDESTSSPGSSDDENEILRGASNTNTLRGSHATLHYNSNQATAGSSGRGNNISSSQANGPRAWSDRSPGSLRFTSRRGVSGGASRVATAFSDEANATSNSNNGDAASSNPNATNSRRLLLHRTTSRPPSSRTTAAGDQLTNKPPREPRPQDADPLIINLLRVSKTVYQEARSILYNENLFTLDLETALPTLAILHQRSRRQIKHVELEIPCYNEILERFQETVRLSLRYCWGLKKFVVHMPFVLPGADGSGTTGNTTVYANGFDILRWLPKQCEVVLRGNVCAEIEAVVSRNANLARTLDELAYARRQLISNESEPPNTQRQAT
ncbi:hypothetical protein D0867_11590 [Hortaea werneckii]|uniref:DUF7730 domain-containing protein n=1 Tax=Hortaea werneckii TaxID=91943 RepID=A0A3M7AM07_HORWE|nr:hypothetical protein D0867_11590 [Hortaea werneckii]RMY28458.1 hypothetical protein D0866_09399 [Hortaea werneckii]